MYFNTASFKISNNVGIIFRSNRNEFIETDPCFMTFYEVTVKFNTNYVATLYTMSDKNITYPAEISGHQISHKDSNDST